LAFKPIQIGQSVFLDEGTGKYNPAPMVLDEAVCNEWPGRDVGVFLSIGTGKRPDGTNQQQHLWWEGFVSGGIGDFAEARRRLIQKIEDCEKTHKEMKDHLGKRHVNPENYYRLNVNVGVGEFGMNEWNALADISTNTRMYLAEKTVQGMTMDAAAKIARIHFAKIRAERAQRGDSPFGGPQAPNPNVPDPSPLAVELPADDVHPEDIHPAYRLTNPDGNRVSFVNQQQPSDNDKYLVVSSDEFPQVVTNDMPPRHSGEFTSPGRRSDEQFNSARPDSMHSSTRPSFEERLAYAHAHAPPRPPKTPLQDEARMAGLSPNRTSPRGGRARPPRGAPLPYPDTDGPPPVVNKATKPEFTR
jgi:hypothetical protein